MLVQQVQRYSVPKLPKDECLGGDTALAIRYQLNYNDVYTNDFIFVGPPPAPPNQCWQNAGNVTATGTGTQSGQGELGIGAIRSIVMSGFMSYANLVWMVDPIVSSPLFASMGNWFGTLGSGTGSFYLAANVRLPANATIRTSLLSQADNTNGAVGLYYLTLANFEIEPVMFQGTANLQ